MITINRILKSSFFVLVLFVVASSCKKTTQPAFSDYPVDANPPGGPLKFYAAYDGTTTNPLMNGVDSIRANFPASNSAGSGDGITGKSYEGNPDAFAQYAAANDFSKSTSFTLAFWLKKTPQAAGLGTNFAFALNSKDYSWTNLKMFLLFEDGGQSTTAAAAAKFYLMDQWFEFVGTKAMPNVLNGEWHQLVFTYDESTSVLSTYIDGVAPTNLPAGFGNVTNGGSPRGPLVFDNGTSNDKPITGFTIGGAGTVAKNANGWMGNFDGSLDQFRLYSTVLSPSEVLDLYNSKL